MNKEFFEALDRAIAVASKYEKELLSYPDVITVGAGPRRRAGKLTGEAAIVVTVRKKTPSAARLLPKELEGIPVDVVEPGKPVEAPEISAAQEQAKRVLERISPEWLTVPNVTGLGVSYKQTKGQTDFSRVVIRVYVEQKFPVDELRSRNLPLVPAEIEGIPTDVVQMPRLRPTSSASGSRDDRKDPLVGGITVGVNTKPFWYGTLGAIVYDRGTGEQMVLSNQHVLDGPAGTEVVQPSPIGLDDSLEIGFQLDICNPIHFFRLDTPNTTVGSVLAGAAVAAATAAALSDEIDPTRRGQEATVPPAGARTLMEHQNVRFAYPELPTPGKHFRIKTEWKYIRHTDAGDFSHTVSETKRNPHALADKLLITDKRLYHPGETIRLFGLILPEQCAPRTEDRDAGSPLGRADIDRLVAWTGKTPENLATGTSTRLAAMVVQGCRCDHHQATALLTPTSIDRAFPVVLRQPVTKTKSQLITDLLQVVHSFEDRSLQERVFRMLRYGCLYTGELTSTDVPTGPWKHYLYVQTINYATDGMKPTDAAKIIGGLPVSNNTQPTLDVACGPAVFEDGQFDIELT